jgi:hypothetical protein
MRLGLPPSAFSGTFLRVCFSLRTSRFRLTVWRRQAAIVMTEKREATMRNHDSVEPQLTALPRLSSLKLRNLWQTLWGRAAAPGIRRELMIPILAYRAQEKAFKL